MGPGFHTAFTIAKVISNVLNSQNFTENPFHEEGNGHTSKEHVRISPVQKHAIFFLVSAERFTVLRFAWNFSTTSNFQINCSKAYLY